jgi:dinuclear metal center YbgI/SA1388 family protein
MGKGLLVKDLLVMLEGIAATALAEDWDNVGLMVGDPTATVSGIMVALDPTGEVLDEAGRAGCNTIVTHHPLIFKPLRNLSLDEPEARVLCQAIQAGIAVISCHTNLDKIIGGVSDMLAARLNLERPRPLAVEPREPEESSRGFGRIGELPVPLDFSQFVALVKERLGVPLLPVAGRPPAKIVTVAVCGGSGSELAPLARQAGAQVYLSGEIKHSMARWAEQSGFCLVDAGHFATENQMVPGLAGILRQRLAAKKLPVEVLTTEDQGSPFHYY